jgi:hypothetical protein
MSEPAVRIFIDDALKPIREHAAPADVSIDTREWPDGEHRLRIEATAVNGDVGIRIIPIRVRNGPGITVSGLEDGATVHGAVAFHVNVFGASEPFEPRRAESRSPTPVWVFVLCLAIAAWSAWYVVENWQPPTDIESTPSYTPSAH